MTPTNPSAVTGKHTEQPDKWTYDEPATWYGIAGRVCNDKGEQIAQVQLSGWPIKKGRGHGNLIAAAPDLLEACKEAVRRFDSDDFDATDVLEYVRVELRAAIAKAEGGGK